MKNFFKKLAFVLALALVVTAIAPAGKASAATKAPSLKKSSKVLYIGGDKTGNIEDTYRFTFNNAAGYTATWKSSKKAVATVDAKSGKIQAVGVGASNITATLTNKAGKAVELVAKVWVKQNAEKIGFGSLAAVKNPLAVGDTAKVNVYRAVGDTKVWKQTDKTLVTDVIKWTSSDESVATVDKWGKVTAVAAGKAVITATATQSEGSTAVVSKSFNVEVAAGLKAVKQTGLNTIEATFAGDLSAVANKENVKVYSVVGNTKVVVVVKALDFDKTDKTKAIITTYVELAKDVEYVVEYKDTTDKFVGADTSKDAIASIKIATTEVKPNEATEITFKVYDKNGIDITKKEYTDRIDVAFAAATTDAYLDTTTKKITFFAKDKTASVKASYHTYTYGADFKEVTIDAVAEIVSKETANATVTGVDTFTVYKTGTTPAFDKAKNTISISDTVATYSVAVQTKNSKGDTVKSTDAGSKFTFESSDKTTLLVTSTGELYPVKEGGASVIVSYDKVPVGAFNVIIGAKRVAYDVTTTWTKSTLSKGNSTDSLKLTVEVKDQYGEAFNVAASAEYVTGAAAIGAPTGSTTDNKTEFVFAGTAYTTKGSYQYKIKAGDQTRWVSFNVDDSVGSAVSEYRFSNAGISKDTALKFDENTKSVAFDMEFESYASNGYKIGNVTIADGKTAADTAAGGLGATGSAFYVEILDPDNNALNSAYYTVSGNKVTINPVIVSGTALKLKAGSYTVKAFEYVRTATSTAVGAGDVKPLRVVNFVITDTQAAATVAINSTNSNGSAASYLTALTANKDLVTVKIGNNEVNSRIQSASTIGTGKEIAITKAVIAVPVKYETSTGVYTTTTFLQEVTIGQTFTFANN